MRIIPEGDEFPKSIFQSILSDEKNLNLKPLDYYSNLNPQEPSSNLCVKQQKESAGKLICENNKNGYIVNKYHELVLLLNSLSHISTNNYSKMCIESKNIFIKKFCYQNMIEDYLQLIKLIQ